MANHSINDARHSAALKRSRQLVTGIVILLLITAAFTAFKTFF